MKRYYPAILLAWLAITPIHAFAQELQPTGAPQNVEEPDAPDDDDSMGGPQEAPVQPIPTPKAGDITSKPIKALAPQVPAPQAETPAGMVAGDAGYDGVVLQGLNKVTARAQTIEAPIGSVVRFGTIEIVAHSCWKAAPDAQPENAALLEISEIKQGEAPKQIFLGWMFSSSPGLSALEHPFYDITVVKCEKTEEELPKQSVPAVTKKVSKKTS